ncbi:Extracellular solute-binding protein, family 7 [Desulfofundulus kuznetsovii DSM 6115]|uniref:Extracellular solute-binding protein, family 7 n=1 Tax=Desulfofundulus kuznetsovii (strain DSM 6115 / VKM B-1805 / 17) TaxID=760568 RepID=A0AAU8PAY7_DESK7|nr:Extracellular solute-binding protein, family 7 [Desulfofundulus kuznetsovii DSM 6115]
MRKTFIQNLAYFSLCFILTFTLSACGAKTNQQGKEETITLKMADSFPVNHICSRDFAKFFIDRVEKLTNGKVRIEYYPAEQIGKLKDLLDLTSQGVIDIGYAPPSFLAGKLSLNTVMIIPEYYKASQGSEIYNRLAKGILMQEFQKYGVRPIFVYALPQYDVGTVRKPIKSPDDLKGLKLKTSGGLYDKIASRYGVTPVVVPSPEVYEATQRGVVEGNFFSFISVRDYRVNELEKYHTFGATFGGYPIAYVINEKTWQRLPADIQKALLQAADELNKHAGETLDMEQEKIAREFEQQGMVIYRIPPEELERWRAPLKGLEQEWIEEMEKKGLPGRQVYEEYHRLCQEIVK